MRLNHLARRDCVGFTSGFSSSFISSYFRWLETWPLTPVALRCPRMLEIPARMWWLLMDQVVHPRGAVPQEMAMCAWAGENQSFGARLLMPWSALPFSAPSQLPAGFSTWVSKGSSGAAPPYTPFQGLQVPSRARTRWKNSQMWGSNTWCLR